MESIIDVRGRVSSGRDEMRRARSASGSWLAMVL